MDRDELGAAMFKKFTINSLLTVLLVAGLALAQDQPPKVYPVPVERVKLLKEAVDLAMRANADYEASKAENPDKENCRQLVTRQAAMMLADKVVILMLDTQMVVGAPLGYVLDMEKWQFEPPDLKAGKKEKINA